MISQTPTNHWRTGEQYVLASRVEYTFLPALGNWKQFTCKYTHDLIPPNCIPLQSSLGFPVMWLTPQETRVHHTTYLGKMTGRTSVIFECGALPFQRCMDKGSASNVNPSFEHRRGRTRFTFERVTNIREGNLGSPSVSFYPLYAGRFSSAASKLFTLGPRRSFRPKTKRRHRHPLGTHRSFKLSAQ